MANIIEMPKLSDTMTTGTLVKWLKNEGDEVKNGDMIAEVETDKATMELESFFDGTLLKIFTPAGSQVELGAPLCVIGQPGEDVSGTKTAKEGRAGAPLPPETSPASAEPKAQPGGGSAPALAAKSDSPSAAAPADGRAKVSPYARKVAGEKGIDPTQVAGSGPGGRVVAADVRAATPAAAPSSPTPTPAEGEVTSVSNMKATIARRLVESKTRIPHFYVEVEIDAEPMLTLRAELNAALEAKKEKLSVNDFIMKASAEALQRVPAVNASYEPGVPPAADKIRRYGASHVSVAVSIDDGLITPVIRDAEKKSILDISRETRSLAELARGKKLQPSQFTGGTFCVSNMGMKGIDRFYAIINPPNGAILAVGAIKKKPVVKNDQLAIGQVLCLGLSCDHRVVNGTDGADFLMMLKELLERPAVLLL